MTEKRFTLVDDYLIEYDGSYFDLHKPSDIRSLVTVIGYVTNENEKLKQAIAETEKMVQSTYDELTKLRCFKKNILRIKHSWDHLMEAIQYD